ncbi:hypothetical protein LTR66_010796 [Elasticomyces elasticus]|nr:hypothetical protein LTR28_004349 [Elasticomyces elasticus]KAK4976609.1 hypothetical protein LTR66_010796 [Elasticomyces elasticus]
MLLSVALTSLLAFPLSLAQEAVLGVYVFHRHGDRTSKSTPPANLTDLGYQGVYASGAYYRSRYITSEGALKINGISKDFVRLSQISVSAPADTVLQNSAQGFLQGLYPPVGEALASQTLRNGTNVTSPLNGYQLIPVGLVSTGGGSEDNSWLQSASGCKAAISSSNNFFYSDDYTNLLSNTRNFYSALLPVVSATFNSGYMSFKNAYTIYDLVHVAEIHNATIPSSDLLTTSTLHQMQTLADAHEWGLAYNASDNMRAISGMTLAAQIVQFLNNTIATQGRASKIGIQFGAYASFASFFGLTDLPSINSDFFGIVDYASAMTFELFTNNSDVSAAYEKPEELYVRFLFHNGTTSDASPPVRYPLFGQPRMELSWSEFTAGMNKFAIGTTREWCSACGNSTGTCAEYANPAGSSSATNTSSTQTQSGNRLSPAVSGVLGAMVTLAVVLGVQALIMILGGLKVVKKNKLSRRGTAAEMDSTIKA